MPKARRKLRDKFRMKSWYPIFSPSYFGETQIGLSPCDDPSKLIGRIIETTLYDITGDFPQQYIKLYFQIVDVKDKKAKTIFKRHEYSRDYLRSLVRRGSTRVDGIFNVTTKDGYRLRVSVVAFTVLRIKSSQEDRIRLVMQKIIAEKGENLTFDQFAQEAVLGKIASDIYNEAKKIAPLRHVGVRKSKLLSFPSIEKVEAKARS